MGKGLEALKEIGMNYARVFKARENGKKQFVHDYLIIEKELKALEILRKVKWTIEKDFNKNYGFICGKFNKEEYDLLKEVLL